MKILSKAISSKGQSLDLEQAVCSKVHACNPVLCSLLPILLSYSLHCLNCTILIMFLSFLVFLSYSTLYTETILIFLKHNYGYFGCVSQIRIFQWLLAAFRIQPMFFLFIFTILSVNLLQALSKILPSIELFIRLGNEIRSVMTRKKKEINSFWSWMVLFFELFPFLPTVAPAIWFHQQTVNSMNLNQMCNWSENANHKHRGVT